VEEVIIIKEDANVLDAKKERKVENIKEEVK
jgi:hypothetical protein